MHATLVLNLKLNKIKNIFNKIKNLLDPNVLNIYYWRVLSHVAKSML